MIADHDVALVRDAVTGANEGDAHLTGVAVGRDYQLRTTFDLRRAAAHDPCPKCGATLDMVHGIEVGHVFKLGTKYSTALGAHFLDEKEQRHPIVMGCYGIGVNRIIASLAETSHDDNGLIWPLAVSPYEVLLLPLNVTDPEVLKVADRYAAELEEAGVELLFDDRDVRPGVKFKDADLIGIPLQIVIGGKGLQDGQVEIRWRRAAQPERFSVKEGARAVLQMLSAAKEEQGRLLG
jgi:prolyl-tRNA synthetase